MEPGAAGFWGFDETSGTTALDTSGLNNHGTLATGTSRVTGRTGGALAFNGTTGKVTIPDNPTLDITNALTITAWVKPDTIATQYILKKAQASTTDGYELSLASTGRPFFRINRATSADTYRANAPTAISSNGTTWTHLVGVYDGTRMRLYVNGTEVASINGPTSIGTNNLPLVIGAEPGDGAPLDGTVDDARIYNRALTTTEITNLYTTGTTTPSARVAATSSTTDNAKLTPTPTAQASAEEPEPASQPTPSPAEPSRKPASTAEPEPTPEITPTPTPEPSSEVPSSSSPSESSLPSGSESVGP